MQRLSGEISAQFLTGRCALHGTEEARTNGLPPLAGGRGGQRAYRSCAGLRDLGWAAALRKVYARLCASSCRGG